MVTDNFGNLIEYKWCPYGRHWKELDNFRVDSTGKCKGYCFPCEGLYGKSWRKLNAEYVAKYQREYRKEEAANPYSLAAKRERIRIAQRKRRCRPEVIASERAAKKTWWQDVLKDPARHARYLENQRIDYHIRKERNTGKMGPTSKARVPAKEVSHTLDSEPLRQYIRNTNTSESLNKHIQRIALGTGIQERTVWSIMIRAHVSYALADRILTFSNKNVSDLWPEAAFSQSVDTPLTSPVS